MIGNMSSQVPQPDDSHVEYYVEQNKKSTTLTDLQKKMIDQYRKWVEDKGKFGHGNGAMGSSYLPPTLNVLKNYGVMCSNCVFYNAANKACGIVTGEIEPDAICKFWVIPQNKIKGGEKNMSNDNLEKGVVPAVDVTATTEPDGKGTMATAKGDFIPANAKEKASRRYAKKSLKKAIRSIEKAASTLEDMPEISKADLPRIGRAATPATISGETGPYATDPHVTKANEPSVGRASSVTVSNETNPYGAQLAAVRTALQSLKKAERSLVGVGHYAEIANSTVSRPAAVVTKSEDAKEDETVEKDITGTVESTVNSVIKAATCCDNACGKCKGPGCGCCADCKADVQKADACDCGKEDCEKCSGMKKSEDEEESEEEEDDKNIKKSVWGGSFLPI